jgi:drug/metabolite transporter (DMT)-like permease
MMRGGTIITTFIFSIVFLKAKVQRHQIVGSILAFVGVLIVGISNKIFSAGSSSSASGVTFAFILGIANDGIYLNYRIFVL